MGEVKKQGEERIKLAQRIDDEQLKSELESAKLIEAAQMQTGKHLLVMHQASAAEISSADIASVKQMVAAEVAAYDKRISELDKNDKEYLAKLQEFENKKKQVVQQGENEVTKITETEENRRYGTMKQAETKT